VTMPKFDDMWAGVYGDGSHGDEPEIQAKQHGLPDSLS